MAISKKPVFADYNVPKDENGRYDGDSRAYRAAYAQWKQDLEGWNKFQGEVADIDSKGPATKIELGSASEPTKATDSKTQTTDYKKLTQTVSEALKIPTGVQS